MTAFLPYLKKQSGVLVGSLLSLICVAYQSLYRVVPSNGDLMIGLPVAKEFAHPGLFSPYDLIVSSGIREPYHLYKYLGGFLYGIHANVDLIWEALFLCFLFLTFLAFWILSFELTQDMVSSALVLAFIAVAHPLRGSLHAAGVPIPSFVSALSVMPFAIGAIVLLLRKRFFIAMALGSAIFNIHPYVGVLTASAVATAILFTSGESSSKRVTVILGGGLFALPNVIYILVHLPSNFAPAGYDFYAQFRLYAMHVFVEDHWREGYGWFFANLAGAVWFARYIDPSKRRVIWAMFTCWFVLMAGYVFNSYVTKNTTVLVMFLFRATYFVKPIVFILVVHGIRLWRDELRNTETTPLSWWKPWELSGAIALLFFSSILPMKFAVAADVLALIAYGLVARQALRQSTSYRFFLNSIFFTGMVLLFALIIFQFPYFSALQELVQNVIVGIVVAVAIALLVVFKKLNQETQTLPQNSGRPLAMSRLILAVLSVLVIHQFIVSLNGRHYPFVPDFIGIKERIAMHRAPQRTAALMEWARMDTPQRSLFVVPPDEWDDFSSFRLVAERGLFVTIVEVNQLAFDKSVYHEAHQRMIMLGVTFPQRREYDAHRYYELTSQELRALVAQEHADYFIAEKDRLRGEIFSLPAVYQDDRYVVINLHDI